MPKRTDGLYQRGQRWYFKFKTEEGWKEHGTGSSDYKEAKDKKAQFLADLKQNKLPNERGNWSLQQAVDDWKASRKLRLQPGSYASEVSICTNLVANLKPDTKLKNLTTAFTRYQDRRLEDEASHKTINNETTVLSAMLKAANLQVTYKKLKLEENEDIVPFTPEEQQRLVQYARVSDENAVVPYAAVLALSTGMRGGEIKKLQLKAIDLDKNEILIPRFVNIDGKKSTATKTKKGNRRVVLDTLAVWAVRKLMSRAKRLGATEPTHFLLPTLLDKHTKETDPLHGGTGYDPTHPQASWSGEWETLSEALKINHRFHNLRHSYITRAAEAGLPIEVMMSQVGHMSAAMIRHYTHISTRALHRAAKQLENHEDSVILLKSAGMVAAMQ